MYRGFYEKTKTMNKHSQKLNLSNDIIKHFQTII